VELSGGDNVFQAHLQSFSGMLPERPAQPRRTAGRIIVYAPCDLFIEADLVRDWTADVPGKGARIAADDPILSILALGSSRNEVMAQLKTRTTMLGEIIKANYQDTTL
jgi:predicted ATP-grasp superfamily ATP-dependent carboligase